MAIDPKYTLIIGTSGSTDSTDFLHEPSGTRRFWPVSVLSDRPSLEDGEGCDGLHDVSAPSQYLCSRCFPAFRGDLAEPQDDECDEARRDETKEMG